MEIIKCQICGQDTCYEKEFEDQPGECKHCQACDIMVCADCFCWATADEATNLCKDCCGCYNEECERTVKGGIDGI